MFSNRQFVTLLAALIAVAHLHCVFEYQMPALGYAVDSQHPVNPAPEKHCDNEFGCICKGATLVQHALFDLPEMQLTCVLGAVEPQLGPADDSDSSALAHAAFRLAFLPSGKMLRAQISSLTI
jgi:hypothetical protein